MVSRISKELMRIEQEKDVRILYACEAGSRAWGFESPDSDYDVRFIYARPLNDYLAIDGRRDVIEQPISGDLDISGWDIKKALRLLRKSNPPLLEWLNSPIVYYKTGLERSMSRLAETCYSARACSFHYFHMASGNYQKYLTGDVVSLKKYFYVIRPLLAVRWMREYDSPPSVKFTDLVEATLCDGYVLDEVYSLIEWKVNAVEKKMVAKNKILDEWVTTELDGFSPCQHPRIDVDVEPLNRLFRSVVSR